MRVRPCLDTIAAHARRDAPRECCGLLIGTDTEVSTEAVPVANEADDPLRRYEVPPIAHLAQIRRCRELKATGVNVGVVGAYHSHPRSAAEPSPTDREQAFQDFLCVIDRACRRCAAARCSRLSAQGRCILKPWS